MARRSHRRETRHVDPLASERISVVLEMEVQTRRSAGAHRLRKLIAEMAENNPTWGEERIADELLLKIGIQISPRTVRRYMPTEPKQPGMNSQRWLTFVRNHAKAIIACDFFIVVTATFRLVYVFVIMEVGSRKILQFNTTCHPTADWTLQQFRECVTGEGPYKFIIHDRDSIYSRELDLSLQSLGLTVLRTPYRTPQANAFCERLVGSARRECLDFMIPMSESHTRMILKPWVAHFNQ
jgi:putative transposase